MNPRAELFMAAVGAGAIGWWSVDVVRGGDGRTALPLVLIAAALLVLVRR